MSFYSHNETSLAMSTLAIWCRFVRSRVVRSRDFSAPMRCRYNKKCSDLFLKVTDIITQNCTFSLSSHRHEFH